MQYIFIIPGHKYGKTNQTYSWLLIVSYGKLLHHPRKNYESVFDTTDEMKWRDNILWPLNYLCTS